MPVPGDNRSGVPIRFWISSGSPAIPIQCAHSATSWRANWAVRVTLPKSGSSSLAPFEYFALLAAPFHFLLQSQLFISDQFQSMAKFPRCLKWCAIALRLVEVAKGQDEIFADGNTTSFLGEDMVDLEFRAKGDHPSPARRRGKCRAADPKSKILR